MNPNPHYFPAFAGRVLLFKTKKYCLVRFIFQSQVNSDKFSRLKELKQATFKPQEYLILEQKTPDIPTKIFELSSTSLSLDTQGRILPQEYHTDYSIWKVELPQEGFVFFSEIWYPGWKVFANGNKHRYIRRTIASGQFICRQAIIRWK